MLVPITEAKTKLFDLVRVAEDEDVVLLRHSRPAGVIVGAERFEAMLEELEDLRDRLALAEHARGRDETVPFDRVAALLGIDTEPRRTREPQARISREPSADRPARRERTLPPNPLAGRRKRK